MKDSKWVPHLLTAVGIVVPLMLGMWYHASEEADRAVAAAVVEERRMSVIEGDMKAANARLLEVSEALRDLSGELRRR